MKKRIAAIGTEQAFKDLCRQCNLTFPRNDVFVHVNKLIHIQGMEFSKAIHIGNPWQDMDTDTLFDIEDLMPTRIR